MNQESGKIKSFTEKMKHETRVFQVSSFKFQVRVLMV